MIHIHSFILNRKNSKYIIQFIGEDFHAKAGLFKVSFFGENLLINSLWPSDALEIWVNIGSRNGLLPDSTKPLPEPMSCDIQWRVISEEMLERYNPGLTWVWKLLKQDYRHFF